MFCLDFLESIYKERSLFLVEAEKNTILLFFLKEKFYDGKQYDLEYSCFDQFAIMAGMMADSWSPSY